MMTNLDWVLSCVWNWQCTGSDESEQCNSRQKPSWWNQVQQLNKNRSCHFWSQIFNDSVKSFIQCGVQRLISVFKYVFWCIAWKKYFTDCVSDSAKLILPQKWSREEAVLVLAHFLVLGDGMLSSALLPFGEPINIHWLRWLILHAENFNACQDLKFVFCFCKMTNDFLSLHLGLCSQ